MWSELARIHSTEQGVCWRMRITLKMDEPILTRMKPIHITLSLASIFSGWRRTSSDIPWAWIIRTSVARSCTLTTQATYQICSFILMTLKGYDIYMVRIRTNLYSFPLHPCAMLNIYFYQLTYVWISLVSNNDVLAHRNLYYASPLSFKLPSKLNSPSRPLVSLRPSLREIGMI